MTLVHCTHSASEDMAEFSGMGGNVCVCPLTEGSLADGIPERGSLPSGRLDNDAGQTGDEQSKKEDAEESPINRQITLGTDSNLRIDFLEEIRWLEYGQRWRTEKRGHFSLQELIQIATLNGARALKQPVGEIKTGCFADFACLDSESVFLGNEFGLEGDGAVSAAVFGCGGQEVMVGTIVGAGAMRDTRRVGTSNSGQKSGTRTTASSKADTNCVVSSSSGDVVDCDEEKLLCTPAPPSASQALPPETIALLDHKITPDPDIVKLAKALINIESVSGNEGNMALALKLFFESRFAYTVQLQKVDPERGPTSRGGFSNKPPRYNVLAYPKKIENAKTLRVILNTHMDTVPPFFPAYVKTDGEQKILGGRGANDTKSLLAAML